MAQCTQIPCDVRWHIIKKFLLLNISFVCGSLWACGAVEATNPSLFFPEASMTVGFFTTHSSQTKESQGQRELVQHLLCARHTRSSHSAGPVVLFAGEAKKG